jgi:hypothetical protein
MAVGSSARFLWSERGVLDTTLCDNVCQCLAKGQFFYRGTRFPPKKKTNRHDIAESGVKHQKSTKKIYILEV